jgi:transposase
MSYIVIQKVKNTDKEYVLLANNNHIRNVGARQSRKYLGIYDAENNELILSKKIKELTNEELIALKNANIKYNGKKKEPRISLSQSMPNVNLESIEYVGDTYALSQIAEDTKLSEVLTKCYGKPHAAALLSLAVHQTLTQQPLYLYDAWLENAPKNLKPTGIDSSSAGLSKLMSELGKSTRLTDKFFTEWISACNKPESLICDTTSLSTYSEILMDAEWGYNRDRETLPQINIVLVIDRKRGIPILFRQLPGSVSDIVTIENTSKYLQEYGLFNFHYLLDRGFCSEYNILELIRRKIGFLMAAPWATKQSKDLRKKHSRALTTSPKNSILYNNDQVLRYMSDKWIVGEHELSAHLYFDQTRAVQQSCDLEQRVLRAKNQADNLIFALYADALKWLDSLPKNIQSCFHIVGALDNTFTVEIKTNSIAKKINEKGFTLILSSEKNLDGLKVITDYRQRDKVEKLICVGKNELEQLRLKSGNAEIIKGRLLITFIALILYSEVESRLRDAKLLKTYSVAEVFAQLHNIQAVNLSSGARLMREITKKQRQILQALNLELPQ